MIEPQKDQPDGTPLKGEGVETPEELKITESPRNAAGETTSQMKKIDTDPEEGIMSDAMEDKKERSIENQDEELVGSAYVK